MKELLKKCDKRKSYIYKSNGKLAKKKPLKKGKRLKVFGQKISKGKLYYKISKNSYIKGIDTVGLELAGDGTLKRQEFQPEPPKTQNRLEEWFRRRQRFIDLKSNQKHAAPILVQRVFYANFLINYILFFAF